MTNPFRMLAVLVALSGLAVLASPDARGSGASVRAQSTKSVGRASADTAVFDDATSIIRNPGLIMLSHRVRTDVHLGMLYSRTRFENDLNDDLSSSFGSVVPSFGITWDPSPAADDAPDEVYWRGSDYRIGFNISVASGGGGETDLKTPAFPEGEIEDTNFFILGIAPTFGFRLTETLSIGIQPQLLFLSLSSEGLIGKTDGNSNGAVFFHRDGQGNPLPEPEPFTLSDGSQPTWGEVFELAGSGDSNSTTRFEVESTYGIGYGGAIGLHWQPREDFSVGLSYRFEGVVPSATGDASVDAERAIDSLNDDPQLGVLLGGVLDTFLPDGTNNGLKANYDFEVEDFKIPAILSMGVAWSPRPDWLLAFDLRYVFWASAFDETAVTFSGGDSRDINEINGSDTIESINKQKWNDSLIVAMGTAFAVNEKLVLRAGYSFSQNPINNDFNGPSSGVVEHSLSIGASVFYEAWDFSFAYLYSLPNEEKIDEHKELVDFNDTVYKSEQHWIYFGAGYQF